MQEFSKKIVWLLLLNSIAWTYLSYILAYLGRTEIAETLSKTVVIEILGVVLVYSLKSLFENISKNNDWPDKTSCGDDTNEDSGNESRV
jgi:hypothetical protein